jgi:putative glycerol-1-phosphate prenyltransferase
MTIWQQPWKMWRHVVKLDPDRNIEDSVLRELPHTGTDAIFVGGTQDITLENTRALVDRMRAAAPGLPIWQEISEQHAIVTEVSGYAIPVVLNAGNKEWLIGRHMTAIREYGPLIPWERTLIEGYIIMNPDADVAKRTQAVIPRSPEEAAAYAEAAERIFGMKTLYVEYSGQYGDPEWVHSIRDVTRQAHLFYGGGITTAERAAEMASIVDTIVVGNALYEQGTEIVRETVKAVKETEKPS